MYTLVVSTPVRHVFLIPPSSFVNLVSPSDPRIRTTTPSQALQKLASYQTPVPGLPTGAHARAERLDCCCRWLTTLDYSDRRWVEETAPSEVGGRDGIKKVRSGQRPTEWCACRVVDWLGFLLPCCAPSPVALVFPRPGPRAAHPPTLRLESVAVLKMILV